MEQTSKEKLKIITEILHETEEDNDITIQLANVGDTIKEVAETLDMDTEPVINYVKDKCEEILNGSRSQLVLSSVLNKKSTGTTTTASEDELYDLVNNVPSTHDNKLYDRLVNTIFETYDELKRRNEMKEKEIDNVEDERFEEVGKELLEEFSDADKGHTAHLGEFGAFTKEYTRQRTGKAPNGKKFVIKSKLVVRFDPSPQFDRKINGID